MNIITKGENKVIKFVEGSILDSKANFIINQVNSQDMNFGMALKFVEKFPHIETEYNKYLRYCKKNHNEILGTVQYVPNEVWALVMADTMKNENVEAFDINYQYIVNMFCQNVFNNRPQIDFKAMKKALIDVKEKAKNLNAIVAISRSGYKGTEWENFDTVIKKIFDNSGLEVQIYSK